jgi:hypothetical protein
VKTVEQVLPRELATEFRDTRAYRLRAKRVLVEHDARVTPWPGTHKNVSYWWEIEGDLAVGWNENPAKGWSFPVIKLVKPCPHLTKALNTILGSE